MAYPQIILDSTIKAVDYFEARARGRVAWVVVNAPHISFVSAISRRGAQLIVDGVRIEGFKVPHVSGSEALGSFAMFETSMPSVVKAGARVAVLVASIDVT